MFNFLCFVRFFTALVSITFTAFPGLAMEENSRTGQHTFPQGYSIRYIAEKEAGVGTLDLSGLIVVLGDSRFRGIGNGGEVPRYMGRLMLAHDFHREIVNLPFTVGNSSNPNEQFSFFSIDGLEADPSQMRAYIETAWAERKPLFFNIPLDIDSHASLAQIVCRDGLSQLRFFDSLLDEDNFYENRYCEKLKMYIKNAFSGILPAFHDAPLSVIHLLDQGGKGSNGCGYYSTFTSLLLTLNKDLRHKEFESANQEPYLYTAEDEDAIRAEMVVRSILYHGPLNISDDEIFYGFSKDEHIYCKLGYGANLRDIRNQLIKKLYPHYCDELVTEIGSIKRIFEQSGRVIILDASDSYADFITKMLLGGSVSLPAFVDYLKSQNLFDDLVCQGIFTSDGQLKK